MLPSGRHPKERQETHCGLGFRVLVDYELLHAFMCPTWREPEKNKYQYYGHVHPQDLREAVSTDACMKWASAWSVHLEKGYDMIGEAYLTEESCKHHARRSTHLKPARSRNIPKVNEHICQDAKS